MADRLKVSFEFFPPKNEGSEEVLWESIQKLAPLKPEFVSVTYGAGGTTRERTHKTVSRIQKESSLSVAAHLTCVDATRVQVDDVLKAYWNDGVRHIVALRGDPSTGIGGTYKPTEGGYAYASDLVAGAKNIGDFDITVSCYPETHPEAVSPQADIDVLKAKVDAGATRAITQFFYYNDVYFRFLDRVRAAGITIPIIPGIMPVTNFKSLKRMATLCGTTIPSKLLDMFESLDDDPQTRQMVSASVAAEQCNQLAAQGVEQFHFYTLNRAELAFALCHMMNVRPVSNAMAA